MSWIQKGSDIDGIFSENQFGFSVSINYDGNTIAIGAINASNNGSNSGNVKIYDWNGVSWIQRGTDISGEAANDTSGYSVSLSSNGNTVAIGAPYNDGNGSNSGHVRIYDWNGAAWIQRGVDIDGEGINDFSGWSVSLSSNGNTVAIGATGNDNLNVNAGHVRIYEWNGSNWVQKGSDLDGEAVGDQSGYSISLSSDGNTIAIGAPLNNSLNGHVRVYNWNGSSWVQKGSDLDGQGQSGYSVSLSSNGNTIAVGAPYANESGSGTVKIFDWNGSVWIQRGNNIEGELTEDSNGFSVSLSSNGNIVAIGAPYNSGNGIASGHVRIYNWNGTDWIQIGSDINGEAMLDQSGKSISLSGDGSTIAIGAPFNEGTNTDSGHVRVYYNFEFENGGIGDPLIKPIFGESYYLPNDESTYLLLSNKDNLNIYTKTWIPTNVKNGTLSFMRYLIIDFNNERKCLDLDTMNWVKLTENNYFNHSLKITDKPQIKNMNYSRNLFSNYINDYYNKNYKISKHNKQISILFDLEDSKKIELKIISDLKYQDIRNNINILIKNISKQELINYEGAFIHENKSKKINPNKFFNKINLMR
jgi:hypothetical protein